MSERTYIVSKLKSCLADSEVDRAHSDAQRFPFAHGESRSALPFSFINLFELFGSSLQAGRTDVWSSLVLLIASSFDEVPLLQLVS